MAEAAERLFGVEKSLTGRFWTLNTVSEDVVQRLAPHLGGDDNLARLLSLRGVEAEDVDDFFNPTLKRLFPDPASFADMEKAAAHVIDAIVEDKAVTVFADYDVDGGTSSALLARYFRHWGRSLGLYVPDRLKEGYGPSPAAFQTLKKQGADLVITVDCGAAAVDALAAAKEIGLPVIVIDHHLMQGETPDCAALVNPNREDDTSDCGHLAAAGVVYVFLAALNREARKRGVAPEPGLPDILQWLDLCALGTLCDMSPLRDVNRAFVKQGLKILARGDNVGLKTLSEVAGIGAPKSVYHATFVLGPRLNAGGRISDPWLAAKLLATDDRAEAIALAERMNAANEERKALEAQILDEARAQANRQLEAKPDADVLVLAGEGWHPGVNGIVAGRIKDEFHRPAFVIGWAPEFGELAKGSARSVHGVNVGEAIAQAAREGIVRSGGGHAMAGGVSLTPDQIEPFRDWMGQHMAQYKDERYAALEIEADLVVDVSGASLNLAEAIQKLGPFGVGAPVPTVVIPDVDAQSARIIGGSHLKFTAVASGARLDCVCWRHADTELGQALMRGGRFHILGKLEVNEWNGQRRVQLNLMDAAPAAA